MPSARPHPVVLYSPGDLETREEGTVLVEDLASRGYVVVTLGHTYDAVATEFPDGRVEPQGDPRLAPHLKVALHRADAKFVLDQLTRLNAGKEADPAGLKGRLDLTRVGMFGHSFGGATTAHTMGIAPGSSPGSTWTAMSSPTCRCRPPFRIRCAVGGGDDPFGGELSG